MSKKTILVAAGLAVAGFLWWKNKGHFEDSIRRGARKLRREIDPLEERVTEGLDDLARTIQDLNRKVKLVTQVVDAALGRIA